MARAKLTPKERRFVAEYQVDRNGTQAAIRAGYAARSARVTASRLLTKANVAAAIAAKTAAVEAKLDLTVERAARELALLGYANMLDYLCVQGDGTVAFDFSTLDRDKAAAIGELVIDEYMDGSGEDARPVKKIRFKLADKRGAIVDLMKLLGQWKERHEHSGKLSLLELLPD